MNDDDFISFFLIQFKHIKRICTEIFGFWFKDSQSKKKVFFYFQISNQHSEKEKKSENNVCG